MYVDFHRLIIDGKNKLHDFLYTFSRLYALNGHFTYNKAVFLKKVWCTKHWKIMTHKITTPIPTQPFVHLVQYYIWKQETLKSCGNYITGAGNVSWNYNDITDQIRANRCINFIRVNQEITISMTITVPKSYVHRHSCYCYGQLYHTGKIFILHVLHTQKCNYY
jgi:hypothetical protein